VRGRRPTSLRRVHEATGTGTPWRRRRQDIAPTGRHWPHDTIFSGTSPPHPTAFTGARRHLPLRLRLPITKSSVAVGDGVFARTRSPPAETRPNHGAPSSGFSVADLTTGKLLRLLSSARRLACRPEPRPFSVARRQRGLGARHVREPVCASTTARTIADEGRITFESPSHPGMEESMRVGLRQGLLITHSLNVQVRLRRRRRDVQRQDYAQVGHVHPNLANTRHASSRSIGRSGPSSSHAQPLRMGVVSSACAELLSASSQWPMSAAQALVNDRRPPVRGFSKASTWRAAPCAAGAGCPAAIGAAAVRRIAPARVAPRPGRAANLLRVLPFLEPAAHYRRVGCPTAPRWRRADGALAATGDRRCAALPGTRPRLLPGLRP